MSFAYGASTMAVIFSNEADRPSRIAEWISASVASSLNLRRSIGHLAEIANDLFAREIVAAWISRIAYQRVAGSEVDEVIGAV
ncbi:hypothetical protein NLM33_23200 [Bradyrhizobium sp. CCGUVB1N3]|uniref:hypothetical protein n=1 Tax=Bradyrhizobium sp. CCGUVB1N3 TaxID=2949629 RepID=UPI0020B2E7D1|nr:hypothetical protein [Bradyrhizobium sp. CCGUVB1N3]MCP3473223.1 hypothetical protein [Bradyrhizobium sp. CCGUVB1N3]